MGNAQQAAEEVEHRGAIARLCKSSAPPAPSRHEAMRPPIAAISATRPMVAGSRSASPSTSDHNGHRSPDGPTGWRPASSNKMAGSASASWRTTSLTSASPGPATSANDRASSAVGPVEPDRSSSISLVWMPMCHLRSSVRDALSTETAKDTALRADAKPTEIPSARIDSRSPS